MKVATLVLERMNWPGGSRTQTLFDTMVEAKMYACYRKRTWKGSIFVRVKRMDTEQYLEGPWQ